MADSDIQVSIPVELKIKGTTITLNMDEAKKLYDQLGVLFKKEYISYPLWTRPYRPYEWWYGNSAYITNQATDTEVQSTYKIEI